MKLSRPLSSIYTGEPSNDAKSALFSSVCLLLLIVSSSSPSSIDLSTVQEGSTRLSSLRPTSKAMERHTPLRTPEKRRAGKSKRREEKREGLTCL